MFAQSSLSELEIIIDERTSYKKKDKYTCKKLARLNNSPHLMELLEMLPNLTSLKFAWSINHNIKLLQDEYFNDEELEYKGPFEDWPKKKYKLPEIEGLEIFNIPDYEYDDVMQFIYKMSPSLKFLILKRSRVSATDFMKVLRRADKLEKTCQRFNQNH